MTVIIWTATIASLVAVVLNVYRHRLCFAIWLGTNLTWAMVDYAHGIAGQALLQLVYAGLSVWGFVSWRNRGQQIE